MTSKNYSKPSTSWKNQFFPQFCLDSFIGHNFLLTQTTWINRPFKHLEHASKDNRKSWGTLEKTSNKKYALSHPLPEVYVGAQSSFSPFLRIFINFSNFQLFQEALEKSFTLLSTTKESGFARIFQHEFELHFCKLPTFSIFLDTVCRASFTDAKS